VPLASQRGSDLETIPQYLDPSSAGAVSNVGGVVGHSVLRYVMGEAAQEREQTPDGD